eukprot:jgi/Tetstr1/448706/TSEL_035944.t1
MRAGEKSKTGGGDMASADHIHVSVELGRTESMAALSSVKSFLQVASRDAPPTLVCSRGSVAEVYSKLAVRTKTAELERTLEESEPQAQWYHAACNLVLGIIGAGVLAYPWIMARLGLTWGLVLMIFAGATSAYSSYLLAMHHEAEDGTRYGRFRDLTEVMPFGHLRSDQQDHP